MQVVKRQFLNADHQSLSGSILVDEISSLAMNMTSSQFTGSITGNGKVIVSLDDESIWTLTGDSTISELNGNVSNIVLNGYSLIVNGEAIAE